MFELIMNWLQHMVKLLNSLKKQQGTILFPLMKKNVSLFPSGHPFVEKKVINLKCILHPCIPTGIKN